MRFSWGATGIIPQCDKTRLAMIRLKCSSSGGGVDDDTCVKFNMDGNCYRDIRSNANGDNLAGVSARGARGFAVCRSESVTEPNIQVPGYTWRIESHNPGRRKLEREHQISFMVQQEEINGITA